MIHLISKIFYFFLKLSLIQTWHFNVNDSTDMVLCYSYVVDFFFTYQYFSQCLIFLYDHIFDSEVVFVVDFDNLVFMITLHSNDVNKIRFKC